ncbi:winged helix-turn-helix transcriptional regulator [candidate division KSB1 bacterium]|nr:winged helix-turn-helix transcriptional regulator [candidate division KSB1 bacterium]
MPDEIRLFKALADANRVRILKMLQVRPLCVCEIREILDLAVSTVSQHLSILRDAGLIYDSKESKWVNYYLNRENPDAAVQALFSLLWNPDLFDDGIYRRDAERVHRVDRNQLCHV